MPAQRVCCTSAGGDEGGYTPDHQELEKMVAKNVKSNADALYMTEPFEPARTRFRSLTPADAVRAAAEAIRRAE